MSVESWRRTWTRTWTWTWTWTRRGPGGLAFALLILIAAAGKPAVAAGEPGEEALVRHGLELRKAGHDDQALDAFRSAYQLKATPRAQAQMGMAEQALGRWVDAEKDLKGALASRSDPWIARNAATLEKSLATVAEHLGSVQILGSPSGARVVLDEREVGKLPLESPVRAPAGEVLVTVSSPGFVELSRKVTVSVGGLVREAIALHAIGASAPLASAASGGASGDRVEAPAADDHPGAATSSGAAVVASTGGATSDEKDTAPPDGPGLSTMQSWAIGVGAAGLVAAGVGTVLALQAISKNNASKSGCQGNACDAPATQSRLDAITAGNRATVAFAVGGALVAGGVTMFLVGRPAAGSGGTARFAPVVGPGQFAMVGSFRF